ncbi:MAG TPA: hypothetical protein VGD98_08340 [Ktedonobacteraceae bacterium]
MSWKILRLSLLGSLLLVLCTFFLYRGTNWPLGIQGIEAAGAFLLLLVTNLVLFFPTRKTADLNSFHQKSVTLGLLVGLLWAAEIGMNNILQPGLPTRDILDDLFWALIALIIVAASTRYAYRTREIRIGIKVGFWSGLSSGAVACLTALFFVVAGMQFLLQDPLNRAEWSVRGATSGTADMATYFAYQTLAGGLLHLVVLGAIMGVVLGIAGGVLGKFGNFAGKKMTAKSALL